MLREASDNNNYQNNRPNKLNNNPTNQSKEINIINIINQNVSINIKICNETQDFYVKNPHINCGDKKP